MAPNLVSTNCADVSLVPLPGLLCHLLGVLGALPPANLDEDVSMAIKASREKYGLEPFKTGLEPFKFRLRRSAFRKLKLKGYLEAFKLAAKNPATKRLLLKTVKSKTLRQALLKNRFGRKVRDRFFKWVQTTAGQGAINKARKLLGDLLF